MIVGEGAKGKKPLPPHPLPQSRKENVGFALRTMLYALSQEQLGNAGKRQCEAQDIRLNGPVNSGLRMK
jgi:hypothetical protein